MTAVEWLEMEIVKLEKDYAIPGNVYKLCEQAKEMEKQQIIEAHGDKYKSKSNSGSIVTYVYTFTGEMYYNEKFKKDERN